MIMITDNNDDSDKKTRLKFVVMVSILRYWFERGNKFVEKKEVSVCVFFEWTANMIYYTSPCFYF